EDGIRDFHVTGVQTCALPISSLTRSPVELALAEEVLRDFIPDGSEPKVTVEQIMASTADYFGVTLEDLRGHSRSRVLVNARQVRSEERRVGNECRAGSGPHAG